MRERFFQKGFISKSNAYFLFEKFYIEQRCNSKCKNQNEKWQLKNVKILHCHFELYALNFQIVSIFLATCYLLLFTCYLSLATSSPPAAAPTAYIPFPKRHL